MTGSAFQRWTLYQDDGKRSPAMDVVELCLSSEKGGGLEEGAPNRVFRKRAGGFPC